MLSIALKTLDTIAAIQFQDGGSSSSGTKKYRGSNSNDGGNIEDGVKIAGEAIGSGDKIVFRRVKRTLLLPDEAGKTIR
ncbi:hypothetical protein Tco_0680691 [Tanacetum coccineum]|uniref:Uncharacterized protein n=1 Tax=Tanacetum coccineum TaxID=301880 RepID=A0ABQ4XM23_9ASTR